MGKDSELIFAASAENKTASFNSALFIAEFPGVAKTHTAIAKALFDQGVSIQIKSAGEVAKICSKNFPQVTSAYQESIGRHNWVFVSHLTEFEMTTVFAAKEKNPLVKIGLIEQTEGDAAKVLTKMQETNLAPNLILTISEDSCRKLTNGNPDFNGMIYPIGNAEFDDFTNLDIKANRTAVREKLGFSNEDLVITHIGRPPGAVFGEDGQSNGFDINSTLLLGVAISLSIIADEFPDKQFRLVNLPHPVENGQLDIVEFTRKMTEFFPPNLSGILVSGDDLARMDMLSIQLCAASDLCTTIRSTLGLQVSLLGALDQDTAIPLVLHLLINEHALYLEQEAHPFLMSPLIYKAAPYVRDSKQMMSAIQHCLFDRDLKRVILANQKKLARNFRFGEKLTAPRAALIINLYNEFPNSLLGFQNTAFPG